MSISEADDCSHDEASKLVLENSDDKSVNRKKKKERKSVRISEEDITFFPIDDSGYATNRGDESSNLLEGWSEEGEESEVTSIVEEWTEEVLGNDTSLLDIGLPSHDTILKNKVTFCDTPKESPPPDEARDTEEDILISEVLILDSPPPGYTPKKRTPSLESRDNPFIPGGSLDQEASDILKRATIIRDQFILKDGETERPSEHNTELERTENVSDLNKTCDDVNDVTDDTVLPQNVNSTQALPEKKLNGKIEDKNVSMESQSNDNNHKDGNLSLKDKKKQKKCCSVM